MEYITVRDAAQKWNISERLVQKYCAMGRIEGAKKFGTSWVIPAGAVKPKDPRKAQNDPAMRRERRRSVSYPGLMPLMNTAFEPGKCLEFIHDMADGPQKQIALAEYYYFSGQPEKAVRETELFLTGADRDIQLSACLIYAYANLSVGKIQRARYALTAVRKCLPRLRRSSRKCVRRCPLFHRLQRCFCTFLCRKSCRPCRNFFPCFRWESECLHYM